MTDPLAWVEEGCYLAFRFLLKVSSALTGCLEIREGSHGFHARARAYHSLESVLVGEEVGTGDWKADVTTRLGVTSAWIEGFSGGPPRPARTPATRSTSRATWPPRSCGNAAPARSTCRWTAGRRSTIRDKKPVP